MKNAVKRVLPEPMFDWVYKARMKARIAKEFSADFKRYSVNAAYEDRVMPSRMSPRAVEVQATKDYHRVEKALTLREPKRPFGVAVGKRLDALQELVPATSPLSEYVSSTRSALSDWNSDGRIADGVSPFPGHGHSLTQREVEEFFETRHSVRNFDSERPIDPQLLRHAGNLAMSTPSVCNRQAWRVRFVMEDDAKMLARRRQNGNAGFGDIPVLAIVTTDARLFAGPGERNQAWIDGGMFAMSLSWALHGLGLSSCMLNMSVGNAVADALRSELGIESYELIITQIAIGYAKEGHRVARSPRRSTDEVVSVIN